MFYISIYTIIYWLYLNFINLNNLVLNYSFSTLISFLGFCFPENHTLFDIILLYVEIILIGGIVFFIIIETLSLIIFIFKFKNSDFEKFFFFLFEENKILDYVTFNFKVITEKFFIPEHHDLRLERRRRDERTDFLEEDAEYSGMEVDLNKHFLDWKNIYTFNYQAFKYKSTTEEFFDFFFVLIPSIIILVILIPCVGYLYTGEFFWNWLVYDMKLDIIGYQWYWYYEFKMETIYFNNIYDLNGLNLHYFETETNLIELIDIKKNLENDLNIILPKYCNILLSITSGDVIHSFSIPGYGIKFDAIPGRTYCFILNLNELGFSWGQCSELCGANHAFMPSSFDVTTGRYVFDYTINPIITF